MRVYTGTLKVVKSGYGFIDFESIVLHDTEDLESVSFDRGVFIRFKDFPQFEQHSPSRWMRIRFIAEPDPVRKGAFRAYPPKLPTIEVSFPQPVIAHPSVLVSWCLSRRASDVVRDFASLGHEWYVAIVAQPVRNESRSYPDMQRTTYTFVVGLKEIATTRAYLPFNAPGDYDVVVYLVRSNRGNIRKILSRYGGNRKHKIDIWESKPGETLATTHGDLSFLYSNRDSNDHVEAIGHTAVSVPDGIFAEPPGQFTQRMLQYYGVNIAGENECDVRIQRWLAPTIGVLWLLLWELVKRVYMLILGVGHFVCGGKPQRVWSRACTTDLSASISNLKGSLEYESITEWKGVKSLAHPMVFVGILWCGLTYYLYARTGLSKLTLIVSLPLVAVACVGLLGLCLAFVFDGPIPDLIDRWSKRRDQQREAMISLQVNEIATYATCGVEPSHAPPRTVRLWWDGVKRAVCRTHRV